MGISIAYVDTSKFIDLLEKNQAEDTQRLFSKLQNSSYKIMVPQVVLGETIAKIFTLFDEKEHVTILENFYHILTKYKIDLEKNLPGITNQTCKIMLKLQQLDSNLSNNDALILAHVIADPNSKFFFTNDKTMLINQNVTTYINDLYKDGKRKMKLEIRETL